MHNNPKLASVLTNCILSSINSAWFFCTRQDCKPRQSRAKGALRKSWICLSRRAAPTDSHGFAAIILLPAKLNKAKIRYELWTTQSILEPQNVTCTNQLPTSRWQQSQLEQAQFILEVHFCTAFVLNYFKMVRLSEQFTSNRTVSGHPDWNILV